MYLLILFVYGLSFFMLGGGILLKRHQSLKNSFVQEFLFFGLFGILHGLSEWALFFHYLEDVSKLHLYPYLYHYFVFIPNLLSSICLLYFSISLLTNKSKHRLYLLLTAGCVAAIIGNFMMSNSSQSVLWLKLDLINRYILLFPGAFLTTLGFFKLSNKTDSDTLLQGCRPHFLGLALTFLFYSLFAGWIAPQQDSLFFPFISQETFTAYFGPIEIYRSACAVSALLLSYHLLEKITANEHLILSNQVTQASQKAHRAESLLKMVFNNAADGIITIDSKGSIYQLNKNIEYLFGYSEEELLGENIKVLVTKKYREHHDSFIQEYLKTGQSQIIGTGREVKACHKDGREVPIFLRVSESMNNGQLFFTAFIQDITRLKTLESQLSQKMKLESIGRLAGGVAHDFNNLLGGIQGYISLLNKDVAGNEDAKKKIDIIAKTVDRASELTRKLLDFGRQRPFHASEININQLILDNIEMLRHSFSPNIEIATELTEGKNKIMGDPVQLMQVLLNLTVNASQAMPAGGKIIYKTEPITIDESAALAGRNISPGNYLLVTIRDTGEGIPVENQKKIFDPFFSTKEIGEGSGLGLSVVYGIVQAHQGSIEFSSRPGRGTSFFIYLPSTHHRSNQSNSETTA